MLSNTLKIQQKEEIMDRKEFVVGNRKRLIEKMEEGSILILFSGRPKHCSADRYFHFVVNKNFYYLTGIEEKEVVLVIEKREKTVTQILFVKRPDLVNEKWVGKTITKEKAQEISGIRNVKFIDQFSEYLFDIQESFDFKYFELDLFKSDPEDEETLAFSFVEFARVNYPKLEIKNVFPKIRDLRTIKQPYEIEQIKKAIKATIEGLFRVFVRLRPGKIEYELEADFKYALNMRRLETAFKSIIASGQNATVLHYTKNNQPVESGSLVLFDLGAEFAHYCADISRTVPVNGVFTDRQKTLYNIVLKAQEMVISMVKPGVSFRELDEIAVKVLAKECKKIGLIEDSFELKKYFYHVVSHSLGLDGHDVCDYKNKERRLEEGMVITVEPGLYIEEEEIGIRIEDVILVTKNGNENLSKGIAKNPHVIQSIMGWAQG